MTSGLDAELRPFAYEGQRYRLAVDAEVRRRDLATGRVTVTRMDDGIPITMSPGDLHYPPLEGCPPEGALYDLRTLVEEVLDLGFDDDRLYDIIWFVSRHRLLAEPVVDPGSPRYRLPPAPLQARTGDEDAMPRFSRAGAPLVADFRGQGLEIGAFHSPAPVPPEARVRYVDMFTPELARRYFPEIPVDVDIVVPDILAPAERLAPVADASQDFVIASHLLEHAHDPIGALVEWHRVLKPGGRLLLCVPDKRETFDRPRPRTTLDHLVEDHAEGPAASPTSPRNHAHFLEWTRFVNGLDAPPQTEYWARLLERVSYPIHFHCWIPEDIRELIAYLSRSGSAPFDILASEEDREHSEFVFLLSAR